MNRAGMWRASASHPAIAPRSARRTKVRSPPMPAPASEDLRFSRSMPTSAPISRAVPKLRTVVRSIPSFMTWLRCGRGVRWPPLRLRRSVDQASAEHPPFMRWAAPLDADRIAPALDPTMGPGDDRMGHVDRAALDGLELEYEIRGAGEPIVLVHHGA